MPKIRWLEQVEDHDYDAAEAYLSILLDEGRAERAVARLRFVKVTQRRVNDILRATRREPLPITDPGVQRTHRKISNGKPLSPVLIISLGVGGDIADGYHRVSTLYHADPFASVPCKLAHMPELERSFAGMANL